MQANSADHILASLLASCDLWLLFSNCIYFYFIKNVREGILLRPEVQGFIAGRVVLCLYPFGVGSPGLFGMFTENEVADVPHIFLAM